MEQYQKICARYYEKFDWKSRQQSKEVMDYTGNDQQKLMNKGNGRM